MDIGEGYPEGLLKADEEDILEFYKTMGYFSIYLIPFAGAIAEYYKPKEKKTKVGTIFSILNVVVPLAKIAAITIPYVLHKNYKEDENFIQENNKNKIEQVIEKRDSLEKKLISYEEIL